MEVRRVGNAERVIVTYDIYRGLPADGQRYEVFEGEISVSPAPSTFHQRILRLILRLLDDFVVAHDLGEVFCAPVDVVLAYHTILQPDLIFISKARIKAILKDAGVFGAPDLAVEILSPSTAEQDRTTKRQLLQKHGTKEYWIVDPDAHTITILARQDNALVEVASGAGDSPLVSPLLPGLSIVPSKIFAI